MKKTLKVIMTLILTTVSMTAKAQGKENDPLAAAQVIANTVSATGAEELYRQSNKHIKDEKTRIAAGVLMRYTVRMADKDSRERMIFNRNSSAYIELVREVSLFARDFAEMSSLIAKHPENSYIFLKSGTDLLMEAQSLVRNCVVIAMNAKVPDPWSVSYDKLTGGKETAPNYANDPKRSSDEEDHYNLLLPDERYRIVTMTLYRLQDLRRIMRSIIFRLRGTFRLRDLFRTADPYDYYHIMAITESYKDLTYKIDHFPNPF